MDFIRQLTDKDTKAYNVAIKRRENLKIIILIATMKIIVMKKIIAMIMLKQRIVNLLM